MNDMNREIRYVVYHADKTEKAVKKTKAEFAFKAETVSEISDTIGNYMTVCNNLTLVENYLDILSKITIEDVQETAKKYLNINNAVISVLMPEKQ